MIADIHTHILPGIDDGSPDVSTSHGLLERLREQGVTRVAATPHFYANHDSPERFLRRRDRAMEVLGPVEGIDLRPGAEVYYFEGISDCDALEALAIRDTGLLLVEMPPAPWPRRMLEQLTEIRRKRGLIPVIAHLDRYIRPLHSFGIPGQLEDLPVLVQINADALLRRGSAMYLRMIQRGTVHLLGSDCHDLDSRSPKLDQAWRIIGQKLGPDAQQTLLRLEETLWEKS